MKRLILVSMFLIFSLLFSGIALAALTATVSVDNVNPEENQQVTVTVQVTNDAQTSETVTTTLSSSNLQFSDVQQCGTQTISGGSTATFNCIIKFTSVGTGVVTATATGGSVSTTKDSGTITVKSASSSITAAITGSDSVSKSTNFFAGITVTAPSGTDVTNARATLSASGQCSVDTSYLPATQTIGNIPKGNSASPSSWRLTSTSTDGTCSVTLTVATDNAGSASPSKSIIVGTGGSSGGGTTSAGTTGGSGGSGGAATNETQTIKSIKAGSSTTIAISKTDQLKIQSLEIFVNKDVSLVTISVLESSLPQGAPNVVDPSQGSVLKYLEITKVNIQDSDISKVVVSFKADKTWIDSNKIDPDSVSLYRYESGRWNKLLTKKTAEVSSAFYYSAESPGLSVFAIAGSKLPAEVPQTQTTETAIPIPEIPEQAVPYFWIAVGIGIIVVLGIVGLKVTKKRSS